MGDEFQVNAYVTNNQQRPSVGADADGDFVIVWQSSVQDSGTAGIFARRYSSDGVALADDRRDRDEPR